MMKHNPLVRPFLKWAGGKRQLIPEIKKHIPGKFNRYFEPFVGGGALFLGLQRSKVVINDSNSELTNCYSIIRDSVDELIELLKFYQDKNQEDSYYMVREMDRSPEFKDKSKVERAARLIYLNKTCYNGLFRVNSQGQFNVPFGRYKNPNILDEAVLKAVSKYLSGCEIMILNVDFADAIETASRGDFIYFDPPYDPVSSTASFTGYDVNGFNKTEQNRLKKCVDKLTDRGCRVLLSNAHTPFIVELYRDYIQVKVAANRAINSIADKRGKVDEILIMNSYE
jgi:DNA adenine methylase